MANADSESSSRERTAPQRENLWERPKSVVAPHPLPPGAPEGLEIRSEAPQPLTAEESTLGTELQTESRIDGSDRPHRLVIIGDSISQGFQSFAIHRTEKSWPAMVANAFGFNFSYPIFSGPSGAPGLPFNLEAIAKAIERSVGDKPLKLDLYESIEAVVHELERIRDYWTTGDGFKKYPEQHGFNENLAIWGFDLRDALSKAEKKRTK